MDISVMVIAVMVRLAISELRGAAARRNLAEMPSDYIACWLMIEMTCIIESFGESGSSQCKQRHNT